MYIPFSLFKKINKIINYESIFNDKKVELKDIKKEELIKLSDYLNLIGLKNILIYEKENVFLDISNYESKKILLNTKIKYIIFNKEDRINIIYLYIFIKKNFVSVNHFKSLFGLSKNTILSDINLLNKIISEFSLILSYDKLNGYFIDGDLLNKRQFLKYIIDSYESYSINFFILKLFEEWDIKTNLKEDIELTLEKYNINILRNNLEGILNLFLLISFNDNKGNIFYTKRQKEEIDKLNLDEFYLSLKKLCFKKNNDYEKYYILSNIVVSINFYNFPYENQDLRNLTNEIITKSKEKYAIKYNNINEFKFNFYMHLINSFYRILFDIKLNNNIINEIKKDYNFLFNITKDLMKPLEKYLNKEICENELCYFALYFGSEIIDTRIDLNKKRIKALIVCPDGISSSLILKKQLEQLFMEVEFTSKSSYDIKIDSINDYDIIFSTNKCLKDAKKENIYYLNTILDNNEKSNLIEYMMTNFGICYNVNVSVDNIMNTIYKDLNLNKKDLIKIKDILVKSMYDTSIINESINKDDIRLKNLLSFEYILLDEDINDVYEAIYKSSKILIKNNVINEKYVFNVIEKMKKYKNSCYLTKYFIMPHTFDIDNVNKIGISFLRLKNMLYLNNNKNFPVKFIIFLATNNNYDHLYALNEILNILNDDNKKNILLNGNFSNILNLLYS